MSNSFLASGLKPECHELATELIKAYGMLNYAEARAVQGYTKDAQGATESAVSHLKKTGLDEEDIAGILEPLSEITKQPLTPPAIQSRLTDAQEEILGIAGIFIAACQCGPLKK